MISAKRVLFLSISSLLLLAGAALTIQAQGPTKGYHPNPDATPLPTPTPIAAPDYQPMWAVNGKIRWKKAYGVAPINIRIQESINNRCVSFYVAALDPRTNQPLRGNHSQMWKADDEGDYYVCRYALQLPATTQVRVVAQMGGDGLLPNPDPNPLFLTRAWIGGNPAQSRPPQGGMRAFTGSKYVTLDRRTPRATVDFELYYALPRSDGPR